MNAHPTVTLATLMLAVPVTTAHALACVGAGRAMQWALGLRGPARPAALASDAWVDLATQFLAGLMVFNAVFTVLGLMGQLQPVPVGAVLVLGWLALIASRPRAAQGMAMLRDAWDSFWRLDWPMRGLAAVVVLFFLCLAPAALTMPPTGDAEAFYLAYALIMASSGVLEPMRGTYEAFSSIGLPAELHYAVLMRWQGTAAAKFLVWPVALACGVFLSGIVGRCGGGLVARWVAWTILITSSSFTLYVFDGKVDLFGAAFALAALYWLLRDAPEDGRFRALAWAGLMAGSATVAKFSYVLTLGVAMLVLLAWQRRGHALGDRYNGRALVRTASVLAAWAALAWLPQWLKNGVLYGAPLAPFFGMGEVGSWLNQVWHSPEVTREILLTYPYALVFGTYPMQGGGVSLLLLAVPGMAWIALRRPMHGARWRDSILTAVTSAALLSTVAWVVMRPSVLAPRYILATLLLFAPLAALTAQAALGDRRWWLRLGTWGLLILALYSAVNKVRAGAANLRLLTTGREERCLKASESCPPLSALANEGRPGERVMIAGYYGYWLRSDQLQCRDSLAEQDVIQKTDDVLAALQAGGFRYAVVERSSHGWLEDRLRRVQLPVYRLVENGNVVVYLVPPGSAAQPPQCVEVRPGLWKVMSQHQAPR
ncbi:MAG: hypothetical protein GTN84_02305 [Hydrogenophaga sp.]|uniref:hypothetical protein n=1 Tax=Hydrogenophaga sp. TaxID=1904254 RepID=UPI0016A6FB89|nr:hypothetical protein [Hydrogenophaga sp.]NIM39986.1 hypothetical protein [Hydrogenophaga sp.]NIN25182.1 hypothetical protein [Hydrogenophaga sp.]NIN29749.1 hypothetical protein [Hydrogenophaga sp.]NIN54221.1 hypothetical protein [Hydrogenophaga sp.]NIO50634.1 hypothetical protein [Hydrogenophaga sp.]